MEIFRSLRKVLSINAVIGCKKGVNINRVMYDYKTDSGTAQRSMYKINDKVYADFERLVITEALWRYTVHESRLTPYEARIWQKHWRNYKAAHGVG